MVARTSRDNMNKAESLIRLETKRIALSRKAYKKTDIGNAERLVDTFGDDLRFCHPFNKWLVWDGRRWADRSAIALARHPSGGHGSGRRTCHALRAAERSGPRGPR